MSKVHKAQAFLGVLWFCFNMGTWLQALHRLPNAQSSSTLIEKLLCLRMVSYAEFSSVSHIPSKVTFKLSFLVYSFILIADTQGAKTHFQQYRMSIHLVWGNVGLFQNYQIISTVFQQIKSKQKLKHKEIYHRYWVISTQTCWFIIFYCSLNRR